jgi:hypothetical protein
VVEPIGGIELQQPERERLGDPPDYSAPEWDSDA